MERCPHCGQTIRPAPVTNAVLAAYDRDPTLSSYAIAKALDMEANHVRQILQKHSRPLIRKHGHRDWK